MTLTEGNSNNNGYNDSAGLPIKVSERLPERTGEDVCAKKGENADASAGFRLSSVIYRNKPIDARVLGGDDSSLEKAR